MKDQDAAAKSFARGGEPSSTASCPQRWSEGLGELTGHLIGDGWLTDVQTGWVYGNDDIQDGLADAHEGLLSELLGGVSRQEMHNGTVQLQSRQRDGARILPRTSASRQARAHDKRVPEAIFTAPTEVQAAFLRGLFGADGCVSRAESAGKANRYVGLGSRSNGLLKDVQRLLVHLGHPRPYLQDHRRSAPPASRTPARTEPRSSTPRAKASTCASPVPTWRGSRPRSASPAHASRQALESLISEMQALRHQARQPRCWRVRTTARRWSTTSLSRCTTPTSSMAWW